MTERIKAILDAVSDKVLGYRQARLTRRAITSKSILGPKALREVRRLIFPPGSLVGAFTPILQERAV